MKKNKGIKAAVLLAAGGILFLGILGALFLDRYDFVRVNETGSTVAAADTGDVTYSRAGVDVAVSSEGTEITNWENGYQVTLPKGVYGTVKYCALDLEIDCGEISYDIYMEQLDDSNETHSYLAYSNKFIENGADHKDASVRNKKVGDLEVTVTQWSREKLSRIEADKNHYICADVVLSDQRVCTLLVKSEKELDFDRDCRELVKSLKWIDPADCPEKEGIRDNWAQETQEVYGKYFGETAEQTWGLFKWGIDEDWNRLTELEKKLEYSFGVLLYYSHFDSENTLERVKTVLTQADQEGRTVELTLQTKPSQSGNTVYQILNGEYDDFLRAYGRLLSDLEIPVLFRLCNEMNGDWCEYSAFHTSRDTEIFREMYRYIYQIFEEEGANAYTIWVWNPNERSFPDYKWNYEYNYYPGEEYVDVIGITGYNTGTYYEGETWRSFDEIYEPIYERTLENYDKPIMITEFGCSSAGGDKKAWAEDMFSRIGSYDQIKVAVWWDGCDYDTDGSVSRSYLIEEDQETLEVFRKGFQK